MLLLDQVPLAILRIKYQLYLSQVLGGSSGTSGSLWVDSESLSLLSSSAILNFSQVLMFTSVPGFFHLTHIKMAGYDEGWLKKFSNFSSGCVFQAAQNLGIQTSAGTEVSTALVEDVSFWIRHVTDASAHNFIIIDIIINYNYIHVNI